MSEKVCRYEDAEYIQEISRLENEITRLRSRVGPPSDAAPALKLLFVYPDLSVEALDECLKAINNIRAGMSVVIPRPPREQRHRMRWIVSLDDEARAMFLDERDAKGFALARYKGEADVAPL
jgi:hypothetical protein